MPKPILVLLLAVLLSALGVAAVSAASPACATATRTIRGHRAPSLLEGGSLLRRAGAILGVHLTRG